jgi:hypothetical protein
MVKKSADKLKNTPVVDFSSLRKIIATVCEEAGINFPEEEIEKYRKKHEKYIIYSSRQTQKDHKQPASDLLSEIVLEQEQKEVKQKIRTMILLSLNKNAPELAMEIKKIKKNGKKNGNGKYEMKLKQLGKPGDSFTFTCNGQGLTGEKKIPFLKFFLETHLGKEQTDELLDDVKIIVQELNISEKKAKEYLLSFLQEISEKPIWYYHDLQKSTNGNKIITRIKKSAGLDKKKKINREEIMDFLGIENKIKNIEAMNIIDKSKKTETEEEIKRLKKFKKTIDHLVTYYEWDDHKFSVYFEYFFEYLRREGKNEYSKSKGNKKKYYFMWTSLEEWKNDILFNTPGASLIIQIRKLKEKKFKTWEKTWYHIICKYCPPDFVFLKDNKPLFSEKEVELGDYNLVIEKRAKLNKIGLQAKKEIKAGEIDEDATIDECLKKSNGTLDKNKKSGEVVEGAEIKAEKVDQEVAEKRGIKEADEKIDSYLDEAELFDINVAEKLKEIISKWIDSKDHHDNKLLNDGSLNKSHQENHANAFTRAHGLAKKNAKKEYIRMLMCADESIQKFVKKISKEEIELVRYFFIEYTNLINLEYEDSEE